MVSRESVIALLAQQTGVNVDTIKVIFDKAAEFVRSEEISKGGIESSDWDRIKPGLKVLVDVPQGPLKGIYMSHVVKRGKRTVYIALPRKEGGLVKLPPDTEVIIRFQDEDTAMGFRAVTGGYLKTDPPSINLYLLVQPVVKSLRKYPRARTRVTCEFTVVDEVDGAKEKKTCKGLIKDISAGGVRLVTSETCLTRGQQVWLSFQLAGFPPFENIPAKVVYKVERDRESPEYGICFGELEEGVQDTIYQFVSRQLLG